MVSLSDNVKGLPDIMRACQVDDEIIERLANWINDVAQGLENAKA
jgi:hypothetical protein